MQCRTPLQTCRRMFRFGLRAVCLARTVSDLIVPSMRPVRCEDLLSFHSRFLMFTRTAAALVVSAALTASVAFSQTRAQPDATSRSRPSEARCPSSGSPSSGARRRRSTTGRAGATRRSTSAARLCMPQAHGDATVSGEQGYIQIDAHFKKLDAGVALRARVPHLRPLGGHTRGARGQSRRDPGGR